MAKEKRTALRQFRASKLLTQDQIAAKLGFSRPHYARFENGEQDVTLRFLEALAAAFGISLEEAKQLSRRDNE